MAFQNFEKVLSPHADRYTPLSQHRLKQQKLFGVGLNNSAKNSVQFQLPPSCWMCRKSRNCAQMPPACRRALSTCVNNCVLSPTCKGWTDYNLVRGGQEGGQVEPQAPPICGPMKTSVLLTNKLSRFASVCSWWGPESSAPKTPPHLFLCSSGRRVGPLEGTLSAQKALKGSKPETN